MCVEVSNNNNNMNISLEAEAAKRSKKHSYSLKNLLKQLFKQHKSEKLAIAQNLANSKQADSLESLESLENLRNAGIESETSSLESYENLANERLSLSASANNASCELEDYDFADLPNVPVHFVRTDHGTFFWTATADLPVDNDLIEPLYCRTSNQIAVAQLQDRWAQA